MSATWAHCYADWTHPSNTVERLDHVAHESTDGWNNAGTGHAGTVNSTTRHKPPMAMSKSTGHCRSTQTLKFHFSSGAPVREGGLQAKELYQYNATPQLWGEERVLASLP